MSNNNSNQDADLQNLENMMNSMMQGAFSLLFKDFGGQIFEPSTILNGNNHQLNNAPLVDDYEGSDFKRLAKKSRDNRKAEEVVKEERQIVPMESPSNNTNFTGILSSVLSNTVSSAFNRVFRYPDDMQLNSQTENNTLGSRQGGINWNFSSTKTTTSSDGTQVTITTKKSNGVTETIKRIQHPNGDVEEIRESNQG